MSRRCIIEVMMDNDAFAGSEAMHELARIVDHAAKHVALYDESDAIDVPLRDINGNRVGYLKVDEREETDANE